MPCWEEVSKPGVRAQHSRVEWLFSALRTVMFSVFVLVLVLVLVRERERVGIVRMGRKERCMLRLIMCLWRGK